jgi:CDP-diacylglycerol--serine O-phosphatidyltransferase
VTPDNLDDGGRPGPPSDHRFLRYLAPNAVTSASLVFGMVSMVAASKGLWSLAAWMIVYAVLTDRLDGMVARLVRGTSEFGVQLDSFADFLNFGLAPAFLMYSFFDRHPQLGADAGWWRAVMIVACIAWVLAAVFRLARFNVMSDDRIPADIFFGIPTTLAGGLLTTWFLLFLKYSGPELVAEPFGGARVLGSVTVGTGVWAWFPAAMLLGAFLMTSSLRMLKVGTTTRRSTTVVVVLIVASGYVLGFLQLFPEWLVLPPSAWLVVFLVWGQTSPWARQFTPPPVFPRPAATVPDEQLRRDAGPAA